MNTDKLLAILHKMQKWQKEAYTICRTVATEILVFMANDMDRKYHTEISNAHPIAYALKGTSMTNDCFAKMVRYLIEKCEENDLKVLATASDGQWHKFGIRNWDARPLSVFQLQKDLWTEMKSQSKSSVLSEIRKRYTVKDIHDIRFERKDGEGIIICGHVNDTPLRIYQGPEDRFRAVQENHKSEERLTDPIYEIQEISSHVVECILDSCDEETVGEIMDAVIQDKETALPINEEGFCNGNVLKEDNKEFYDKKDHQSVSSNSFEVIYEKREEHYVPHNGNEMSEQEIILCEDNIQYNMSATQVSEERGYLQLLEETDIVNNKQSLCDYNAEELNHSLFNVECTDSSIPSVIKAAHSALYSVDNYGIMNCYDEHFVQDVETRNMCYEARNCNDCIGELNEIYNTNVTVSESCLDAVNMGNALENETNAFNDGYSIDTIIPVDTESNSNGMRVEYVVNADSFTDLDGHNNSDNISSANEQFIHALNDSRFLLTKLQSDSTSVNKDKWKMKSEESMYKLFSYSNLVCSELTKNELLLCCQTPASIRPKVTKVSRSWPKRKIAEALALMFQNKTIESEKTQYVNRKRKNKSPQKLQQLALNCITNLSKDVLTAVLCEDKWGKCFNEWQRNTPVNNLVFDSNNSSHCQLVWFSQPHKDTNGTVQFHYTDCAHILTCLRTKICTSCIEGLRKKAWIDAALSEKTSLNVGIVQECLDKQSVAYAKRVFGKDVENYMVLNGYDKEATFIRLIRRWYEAEDDPGISAADRCLRRLELKAYLLDKVNFGRFPPKTQYIGGIPVVTYEALLVHIERKLQVFEHLPSSGYNVRALGTQEVEQFFSTMRDLDPSGIGTPKPDDVPDMMATAAYLDNIRIDPNRGFHMRTTKAAVYPEQGYIGTDEESTDTTVSFDSSHIIVRDHFFDSLERRRVKPNRKSGIISATECPSKGQRGVRQYHATDESKMMSHLRKGMADI